MVRSKMLNTLRVSLAACLLGFALNVQASPLNLTMQDTPDVISSFITVTYNATTGVLNADGFALSLNFAAGPDGSAMIDDGLFTLAANIDNSGALSTGTITLGGTIDSMGYSSGTLLTGVLTDFGFVAGNDGGDPLEFLFDVTGGDLASMYGGTGGIIMGFTGATGDFSSDFSSDPFNASADVAAVPVPAAIWLMFSALAGLASIRRR